MTIRTTSGRGQRYDSVLETVGDTPCIRINRIAPEGVEVRENGRPYIIIDPRAGHGCALRADGMGANVIATEVKPTAALKASLKGRRC